MYNKEKQRYDEERSSYVGASLQIPEYLQQEESAQNEGNNVPSHLDYDDEESYKNDVGGEVRSLVADGTLQGTGKTTLESPYNNNHGNNGQYVNKNESESEDVELKENVKLDIGDDEYESDTGSERIDELAADVNYNNNKRRHSRAEREEVMEYEDEDEELKLEDENEKKVEAADSEEGNIVNEIGGGSSSENNEF